MPRPLHLPEPMPQVNHVMHLPRGREVEEGEGEGEGGGGEGGGLEKCNAIGIKLIDSTKCILGCGCGCV